MTPQPTHRLGNPRFACLLAFLLSAEPLAAATYEVGLAQASASPGDVPWESLAAGDTGLVHGWVSPYTNTWVICRQGTAEAPIIVRGVPGSDGEPITIRNWAFHDRGNGFGVQPWCWVVA